MTAHPRLTVPLLALALILTCALAWLAPAPALAAVSDDPVLRRMDAVLEENARLRDEAWKARKNNDREATRKADEALAASEERLERTRAEALAHVANVSPSQVEALRKDGRSWGQAAGELGVHPGFLGIGKAPMYQSLPARKAKKAQELADSAPAKGKRAQKGPGAKAQEPEKKTKIGKKALPKAAAIAKDSRKAQAKAAPEAAPKKKQKKTKAQQRQP